MNLLTVIGLCDSDALHAEKLCDWLYALNGRKAVGHCLLACAADVHGEWKTRVSLSAEMAFESVSIIQSKEAKTVKPEGINQLFKQAAYHVSQHYRLPWVWLDADCVPLKADWLARLSEAYHSQPKRYCGGFYKVSSGDSERVCLNRIAIYPRDAIRDLQKPCDNLAPFERVAADLIIPRATKTMLIQQCVYAGDTGQIRKDAVLLHSDKTGQLVELLRERMASAAVPEKTIGTTKIDMRTKAGRAMKEQQKAIQ